MDWLKKQWDKLNWLAALLAFILGFISGMFSFYFSVKTIAQSAVLKDDKFLKVLSERVRPVCLLNSKGNFYDDYGALAFLDHSPLIEFDSTNSETVSITIKSKEFLRQPPIITSLDGALYQISVDRETTDNLRYVFGAVVTRVDVSMGFRQTIDPKKVYLFRVEVLH